MNKIRPRQLVSGFTIVELLVVIVVIGILAAITIVSYTGISQRAIVASLQSDLTTASNKLKMYQAEHGAYPVTLDVSNCPAGPADTNYCLKPSSGNTFATIPYTSTGSSFTLTDTNTASGVSYRITDSTGPVAYVAPVFSVSTTNCTTDTTTVPGSTIITCKQSDTLVVTGSLTGASVLTVGGGGGGAAAYDGGGYAEGGGGGGQVRADIVTISGTMPVVIGSGGAGGTVGAVNGAAGIASSFGGNTAVGGNGSVRAGAQGANAGAASGNGYAGGSGPGGWGDAGGGGGAGAVGQNGTYNTKGGNGGAGISPILNGNHLWAVWRRRRRCWRVFRSR